jgi:hypothetical protein
VDTISDAIVEGGGKGEDFIDECIEFLQDFGQFGLIGLLFQPGFELACRKTKGDDPLHGLKGLVRWLEGWPGLCRFHGWLVRAGGFGVPRARGAAADVRGGLLVGGAPAGHRAGAIYLADFTR